jgi:Uma2 family endonuclease
MVAKRTDRPATYRDIEGLPPNMVGEIVRGVLYANPRPGMPHTRAASKLGAELDGPFDRGRGGPGGWIIVDEPELHLGEDVLVPDVAGWRRERMPTMPETAFVTLPPDWLCEVLSPSTSKLDRTEKLPVYARERIAHVWFVDPLAKTLEVLRLEGKAYSIIGTWNEDARVRAEPFDAIALELGALWAR